jgi:hypothetical protein
MSDDYKVGYGKPPAKSKFQKGKSGNPSGRPKWKKPPKEPLDFQKGLIAELKSPITITEGGKKKTVATWQALLKAGVADSLHDKAARRDMLKWMVKEVRKEAFVDDDYYTYRVPKAKLDDLFDKFEEDVATWPANLSEATNNEADVD